MKGASVILGRTRRRGFSLIELLIVVAIVAVLVSGALPFFTNYIVEGQRAKARQDLEMFRSAITRFEEGVRRRFTGNSWKPLLGTTLHEIPRDPWGNDYVLDANLGIMGTLGADGMIGGEGPDADVLLEYSPKLTPIRCILEGNFGPPRPGARVKILTSRPFVVMAGLEDQVPNDIVLVRRGGEVPVVSLGALGFTVDWAETRPDEGVLVLICTSATENAHLVPITPKDQINFSPMVISFTELPAIESPLMDAAADYIEGPAPVGQSVTGLRIEKI